jgi:integrase
VAVQPDVLGAAGRAADRASAGRLFADYRARKAQNTRTAQDADLALFAQFLATVGLVIDPSSLASDPESWAGMTHGIVDAFVVWMLQEGAAIASVNRALSTIRAYATLASRAGVLDPGALTLIKSVKGYGATEGKRLDEQREQTRRSDKKAVTTEITLEQARALKAQPDTPQGRRDALIMHLLLDHGLRVGELAILSATAISLRKGQITFSRPKVGLTQTHTLSAGAKRAAAAYLKHDAPAAGRLLRGSTKSGELAGAMSESAIKKRVRDLGERVGLDTLSPHDCRHYWATNAARSGTPMDALLEAGGWKSTNTAKRYIEAGAIANERVQIEE